MYIYVYFCTTTPGGPRILLYRPQGLVDWKSSSQGTLGVQVPKHQVSTQNHSSESCGRHLEDPIFGNVETLLGEKPEQNSNATIPGLCNPCMTGERHEKSSRKDQVSLFRQSASHFQQGLRKTVGGLVFFWSRGSCCMHAGVEVSKSCHLSMSKPPIQGRTSHSHRLPKYPFLNHPHPKTRPK